MGCAYRLAPVVMTSLLRIRIDGPTSSIFDVITHTYLTLGHSNFYVSGDVPRMKLLPATQRQHRLHGDLNSITFDPGLLRSLTDKKTNPAETESPKARSRSGCCAFFR